MKFIGHLDMMRYFQKAVRRAKIDIRYSEGYSPHQIMSFAAPLGVGITSDGEYFDIVIQSQFQFFYASETVATVSILFRAILLTPTHFPYICTLDSHCIPRTARIFLSVPS